MNQENVQDGLLEIWLLLFPVAKNRHCRQNHKLAFFFTNAKSEYAQPYAIR